MRFYGPEKVNIVNMTKNCSGYWCEPCDGWYGMENICRESGYACPDNLNVLFEENCVSVYHIVLVCLQNVSSVCVPGLVFVGVDEPLTSLSGNARHMGGHVPSFNVSCHQTLNVNLENYFPVLLFLLVALFFGVFSLFLGRFLAPHKLLTVC